jgi:hypothetical protein
MLRNQAEGVGEDRDVILLQRLLHNKCGSLYPRLLLAESRHGDERRLRLPPNRQVLLDNGESENVHLDAAN